MFNKTAKDETVSTLSLTDHNIADDLHDAAHSAGRKVRSLYNSASDEISHASSAVTGEIRGNPIRSSAIALGLGFVIGALLRR